MNPNLTTLEKRGVKWIARAKARHGDRFRYNYATYRSAHENTTITCAIHGDFIMRAQRHIESPLNSGGCLGCLKSITQFNLVKKSKAIHGDKFTYDRFKADEWQTKATYTCTSVNFITGETHGDFNTSPINHHQSPNGGCPSCRQIPHHIKWLKDAATAHGDRFIYTRANYVSRCKNVMVVCRDHGPFAVKARHHAELKNGGCPRCVKISRGR